MQGTGSLSAYVGQEILMQAQSGMILSDAAGGLALLQGQSSFLATNAQMAIAEMLGEGSLFAIHTVIPAGITFLRPLTAGGGDKNYAFSGQSLKPFYSVSNDSYVPPMPAYGLAYTTPLTSWGYAEGATGEGEAYLQPLHSRGGDYNFSIGTASLQPLLSLGIYGDDYTAYFYNYMVSFGGYGVAGDITVFIVEDASLDGTVTTERVANEVLTHGMSANGSLTGAAIKLVALNSNCEVIATHTGDRVTSEEFLQGLAMTGTTGALLTVSITMGNTLSLDGAISATMGLLEAISETMVVDGTYASTQEFLEALYSAAIMRGDIQSATASGGVVEIPGVSDSRAWAINLETGASSQYDYYGYNSFFERDGEYYGVADDGVYRLDGATDSGRDIAALVEMGRSDFGTPFRKRIVNVYVGVSSTGKVLLKVNAAGQEYVYEARSSSTTLKNHRVDVGKGLSANYFNLTLLNQDGCDFDLETISFEPVVATRKI